MTDDKSSMLYWHPKIKDLRIPQPRTETVLLDGKEMVDVNTEKIPQSVVEKVRKVVEKFNLPVFIRADQASGKHFWKMSCYFDGSDELEKHIYEVVSANLCADIIGLPVCALFVREFIPMDTMFTAFYGDMPVNPEIRFFIENGKVLCWHWYWIEEAIRNPSIENWKETIKKRQDDLLYEVDALTKLSATEVAHIFRDDGFWSVDFCKAKDGRWILIDMAEGEKSWHPEDCKFNRTPKIDLFPNAKPVTEADFIMIKEAEASVALDHDEKNQTISFESAGSEKDETDSKTSCLNNEKPQKSDMPSENPAGDKTKEEELWNTICGSIDEWQKSTGRNFIEDYENMMRGN